jgi:hypothetical protein
MKTIAALYIDSSGVYPRLPGVDCWDEIRDARLYAGPHSIIAHPPCKRWGAFANYQGRTVGDDDGCFDAAMASVEAFGGVIEHPFASKAFKLYGIAGPGKVARGWWPCKRVGWFACTVWQGHYGHPCPKPTWLAVKGVEPGKLPSLIFGTSYALSRVQNQGSGDRHWTSTLFAELLVSIARSVTTPP